MEIDFNSKDYEKYKDIQCVAHNACRAEDKNHNKEGHRFDISNVILMNMVKSLNLPKGTVALDLGCAEGFHTEQMRDELGFESYGVDINLESLSYAKSHGRTYCTEGDVHKIPFEDKKFDVIFCHEVLEHAIDFKLALGECHRTLKDGGYLVFSVPNDNTNDRYVREEGGGHFSVMTPYEVKQRLIESGFSIIEGYVYDIPLYNYRTFWSDSDCIYPFKFPHLHCIVKKK